MSNDSIGILSKPTAKQAPSAAMAKAEPTDRDRQLIGVLAIARYLSAEQLCRLFYAGRNSHNMRKRLLRLAGAGELPFQPPFLRRLFYRTYEGKRPEIWTLTNAGYALATSLLGTVIKVPKHDVSSAFREHTIVLNE